MPNLGSLTYDLVANTQKFSSGLTKAERIAQRRSRNIKAAFTGIGLAIGGAVVSIGAMVRSVTETADSLDKMSTRLGISVEALSELQHAAELSGIAFNTLTMATQRSVRRIAEAAAGTGEAKDALKELNLSASELNKLSPDRQLEILADAFLKVENSADRVRLAMKLFDSEGVAMLQLLESGGRGLRDMRSEFNALGGTISTEGAQKLVEFKDEMTKLRAEIGAIITQFVIELGPALVRTAELFRDLLRAARDFFNLFDKPQGGSGRAEEISNHLARLVAEQEKFLALQLKTDDPALLAGYERRLGEIRLLIKNARQDLDKLFRGDGAATGAGTPSVTGGGLTTQDQAAANAIASKRKQMESELQVLRDGLKEEEQLILDSHIRRIEQLRVLREESVIPTQTEFLDLQFAEIQAFEEKVAELERKRTEDHAREVERRLQAEKRELQVKEQNFRSLISSAATTSKLLFNINKLFALSDAILNFHSAVSGAYAVGARIGGPPLGAAFAGIAAVAQGARIAAIAGTSYGGGSRTDTGGGGAVPVAPADPNFGFAGTEPGSSVSTNVTINLGDQQFFTDTMIRDLIEAINDQIDDGVVVKGIVVA